MSWRPIGNNVLLRPEPFKEKSDGGLWLPKPSRDQGQPRTAIVIAVGPGKMILKKVGNLGLDEVGYRRPPGLGPGDRVLYLHFRGQDRYAQPDKYGEKLLILDADDILAVVEPADDFPPPPKEDRPGLT
jgi:co-chaperonin GroES (HSP10)